MAKQQTKNLLARLLTALSVLALVFATACASKDKKVDDANGANGTAGADTAQISQEPFTFNDAGSDSGTINGLQTVHFPYDSSTISSEARAALQSNADWIKKNTNATVQVEGHCDTRGSVEYNLALGERRAKAVKDYLIGLGVYGKRMTIISFGKEKPLEIGDTEEVHAKNRRANFVPIAN